MEVLINAGPLTSYNSLTYYLGPKLKEIREHYLSGITPKILMDLRQLEYGSISISALTALLSTCKKLRDFLGYPIPTIINWDPRIQGFLADIEFFKISSKFKIFKWEPEGIIGGYRTGSSNPDTKILYYADIKPAKNIDTELLGIEKAALKEKIAPNFLMRCSNLFYLIDEQLEDVISNTALELIVNALMHAEDIAFVGLQRTRKRITICVCDSGIGFKRSLQRTYKNISYFKELSTVEAIIIASLIQKNVHGLRLAIGEVLNYFQFNELSKNEGWVIISSFDTEVRWQKKNWEKAVKYFDSIDVNEIKPNIKEVHENPLKDYTEKSEIEKGYWKQYNSFLIGSRITFEIQLS